jgi:hypothetical protein
VTAGEAGLRAIAVAEHAGSTRLRPEARNCCASALRSATRPCLPALFEGADDLREEMTLLALVEPGMAASAQFGAFEPVEHEQRAFDPPQLLECEVELVLAAVGREFSPSATSALSMRPVRLLRIGRNTALARRRRGQPPRGSHGCAPHPSHKAFCRSRALPRSRSRSCVIIVCLYAAVRPHRG